MAGSRPSGARMVIGSLGAAFLLGCNAAPGGTPGAETPSPTPTATSEAMVADGAPPASGAPRERARLPRFSEPIATEFQCDCPSRLLGTNGTDRAAILRSLPLPSQPPAEEPSVQVLSRDGEIAWRFDDLELTTSQPAVAATSVLAFDDAVVVPAAGGSLVGLNWSDGSRLWELAGVAVAPHRVPGQADLFTIAATRSEISGGTSYDTHPRISLREVSSGEPRWAARHIDAFTVADDGSRLLAVRFGNDAAELIRVALPAGSSASVVVPGWRGRGTSLLLNEDGTISAEIGAQRHTIRVDWSEPEPAVDDLGTAWTVERPGPARRLPDAEIIAGHDPTGMLLASKLDDAGRPATVFATDDSQAQLWQRPAAEAASWEIQKDGDVAFKNVSVHDTGGGEPVVLLDLRRGFEDLQGAADSPGHPASRVYDLRTGMDLWEWGRSARSGGQTIIAEHGLVLVAEAGELDEAGAVAAPAPLHAALLDLRTGAAVWDIRGESTTSAGVATDGIFAFITVRDRPWLLSTAASR